MLAIDVLDNVAYQLRWNYLAAFGEMTHLDFQPFGDPYQGDDMFTQVTALTPTGELWLNLNMPPDVLRTHREGL